MPPKRFDLGWMRVLDETVRRGSFSAAASGLGLTQPAVSYQIKRLEEQAGFPLLRRRHRGVELTARGRQLHEIVRRTVAEIDELMRQQATSSARPAVRFRTDYAFASYWLIPRMHAFRQLHPQVDIQIVATQRPQPDDMEDADVAVVFGDRADFGADTEIILPEEVVPVCTQAFLNETADMTADSRLLGEVRLINLDAPDASPWFDWDHYLAELDFERRSANSQGDLSFNTYSLVIQATLENQGVALGWIGLVDQLLSSRVLVPAGPPLRRPNRGYLLLPPAAPNTDARQFVSWLKNEAGMPR